jgi:hypothetical protein
VGEGQGESLPAGIRNRINWETGQPSILHWGDATLYLGWYIGVLATEYHMLKTNSQQTNSILEELWFAILAVERLDSVAELYWNKPASVNGFLIRDDVPADFLERHPHLNYDLNQTSFKDSGEPIMVSEIASDYINGIHNAFSQDQLVHLLMGLSLAVNYAPGEINLNRNGKYISINPKEKAIYLVEKMVDYSSNINGKDPWQLRYPNRKVIPNSRGGDLRANATGIAHIGKLISGNKKDFLVNLPLNIIWQSQQTLVALRQNISSLHMALVTAAVSDYWRGFYGQNTTEKGINFQGNYSAGRYLWIDYEANQYGWNILYNYLRIALHNYKKTLYQNASSIIKRAPVHGPYYHLENKKPEDGWAASRRFIDTPPRQSTGSIHFPGNYNGLDFMLFFNLFHIADVQADPALYKKPKNFKFSF